jgi:enamine deaminase RidA (YjgF/YER057c/UK114 family)
MRTTIAALAAASVCAAVSGAAAADVVRYPLPGGSSFPISLAVEVPADVAVIHHSGLTPSPANPEDDPSSRDYYGDTKTQALSVFSRMEESLAALGCDFGDIVKMTVFLVGDPENGGQMDFLGFMEAYTQYFGTDEQPNLPARSAIQVAGLANPRLLVEIEFIVAETD